MDDVVSWDVHLQKFDQGAEANFDLAAAKRVLRGTGGFREAEQGVGELVGGGFAEIHHGAEPSSDVMVSVRAASPAVSRLIYDLAAELRMVVFFPTERGWGVAVVDESQAGDLPGRPGMAGTTSATASRLRRRLSAVTPASWPRCWLPLTTAGRHGPMEASSRSCGRAGASPYPLKSSTGRGSRTRRLR
jgi:hypothetical protein